jgi:opacity protein-like surface antigen
MKRLLLAVCLVALFAPAALAADVSGTWTVDGDVYGHPVNFTCVLKQDGETLSGTATLGPNSVPVTGRVTDRKVAFEYDATGDDGTTYHLVFTGTLGEDGGLKGTIAVAGVEGTFTATRQ